MVLLVIHTISMCVNDLQAPCVGLFPGVARTLEALRAAGFEVVGMVASYTYGFPVAQKAFEDAGVKLVTLTDYEHVVEEAVATGYITEKDVELLHEWRKDPANFK